MEHRICTTVSLPRGEHRCAGEIYTLALADRAAPFIGRG